MSGRGVLTRRQSHGAQDPIILLPCLRVRVMGGYRCYATDINIAHVLLGLVTAINVQ